MFDLSEWMFEPRLNRLGYGGYHALSVGVLGSVAGWFEAVGWSYASTLIAAVATLLLMYAAARRLHDLGLSGWWQSPVYSPLLALVIATPLVDREMIGAVVEKLGPTVVLGWLLSTVVLWFAMAFIPGRNGENRYGPQPKPLF